jgi:chemotaxis protein methyltransferase CheR
MANVVPPALIRQASAMIEKRIGIAVHTQFRGALDEILLSLSGGDVAAFIEALDTSREAGPDWEALVDALTIGETYFLRDKNHFRLMRKNIFPAIINKHRNQGDLTINVWSLGCATGEEPYSLAITLSELLPDINNWTIRLLGTDINGKSLHTARRGVYRKWAFRHTDLDFQRTYFDPVPKGLQIRPFVREMVSFQHANLFTPTPSLQFDLVLCRHVLLYFSEEHTQKAEAMIHNTLAPAGWLILGQSETLRSNPDLWTMDQFPGLPVYQKPQLIDKSIYTTATKPLAEKKTTDELRVIALTAYQKAVIALQQEDYDVAENLLNTLLEVDPEHTLGHVLLASIEANHQRVMDAHTRLDTALELNPLLADGYYLRALLFMEEDETDAARQALNGALYCDRYHPLALFMLGNVLAQMGQIRRATRYWETAHRAIAHIPSDDPVSDISNMSAGQLDAMVQKHLDGWQA